MSWVTFFFLVIFSPAADVLYTLITTPATFCLTDLNLFKAEGVNHLFVINFESLFALLYVSIKRRGNDGIPGRFDDVPRNG